LLLEEDIRQLLKIKTENKNLDYKEGLNWDTGSKDQKLEIIKDILAMANTQDGGRIVFGVKDKDIDYVGLSEDDFKSFDPTKVNDFLHNYTEPKHSCYVYKQKLDEKFIVIIDVPEFPEVPIICKNDAHSSIDKSKQILKKGQIYIRTEKASSEAISSVEEMREFLGRALIKKSDELLQSVERLIKGKPLKPTEESKEKYREEIKEADEFFTENIGDALKTHGYWEVIAYPTDYNPKRISDHKQIKELIEKSEAKRSGWNFPFTDLHGNSSNFTKGRQSFTIDDMYIEGYRAYQSGLFAWKSVIWEDVQGYKINGNTVLSFERVIIIITEFFLFFKRYYELIAPESDLHFEIAINGAKNRKIFSLGRGLYSIRFQAYKYISTEKRIYIYDDKKVVELKVMYKEIAIQIIKRIFTIFNWNEISEEFIDKWQTKLLEGES